MNGSRTPISSGQPSASQGQTSFQAAAGGLGAEGWGTKQPQIAILAPEALSGNGPPTPISRGTGAPETLFNEAVEPIAGVAGQTPHWVSADSDMRRRLLSFVAHHPGCTVHAACQGIGLTRRRLLQHLDPLKEGGAVAEVGERPRSLLVLNRPGIRQHTDQLRALADPDVRAVYHWLSTLGEPQARHLIRLAAVRGWPRASVYRWLSLLERVGLARHRREGRPWSWIQSLPPAPPVRDALELAQLGDSRSPSGPLEAVS